jgi:hypothetical protein
MVLISVWNSIINVCVCRSIHLQVGDPNLDHQCWVRPENMKAPRTLYEIDEKTPGTEIAAETAAAFAAASMVFRNDQKYSRALLNKAKLVRTQHFALAQHATVILCNTC